LACVRFSLRADKSSLHPLLLTGVRSCTFCGDLFDHSVIANYVERKSENISIAVTGYLALGNQNFYLHDREILFCGLVSWRTASGIIYLRKLRPPC